jgi:riboflavin kinase/FMN adenylyltransferase
VIEEAKKRGLKSVLLTFPEHPAKVLRPDVEMKLLTIQEEKEELLATSGADFVAFLPFTRELAQLSAHDFMQQVLKEQLQVKVLVIGYDHRFGHNRDEGFEDYVRYGKELGIEVVQAKELDCGKHVSSSTIRKALAQGDVAVAQDYLGYPYFLEGEVVEAFHIGRKIGFPTANIHVSHDKLIPQNGVYAVSVRLEDGTEAYGMLNIGSRPTLDNGSHVSIEVHIFHFHENIYGKHLRISFLKYIRKEQKFNSLEELQAQLERDKEECEKLRMKN